MKEMINLVGMKEVILWLINFRRIIWEELEEEKEIILAKIIIIIQNLIKNDKSFVN